MQYCTKCRRLCGDEASRCPVCRGQKLRPAGAEDMAFLCRCEAYEGERLGQALAEGGVPHSLEDQAGSYFSFDSDDSPTGKALYVPAGQMEAAREIAAAVGREMERERGEEQEAEPPSPRRLVGEILSVLAFLVLIMAAVYGADGLADWLKSLWGAG